MIEIQPGTPAGRFRDSVNPLPVPIRSHTSHSGYLIGWPRTQFLRINSMRNHVQIETIHKRQFGSRADRFQAEYFSISNAV